SDLARQMFTYGSSVIGVDFLTILNDTLDYLIIGRILGSVALGIYTLAYRLPELLVFNILWVLSGVIFPTYSAVQTDKTMLEQAFWTTMRYVELIIVPLCLGLIITADPLVRIAFGDQWLDAIPIMQLLALFALVRSVGYHIGDIYKAIGQPDILFKLGLISLALLLPALWIGAGYGLIGVAIAHVSVAVVRTLLRWIVAARFIEIRWGAIWTALKPSIIGGTILALLAIPTMLATADFPPIVRLSTTAVAGALGYVAVLWHLERDSLLMAGRYLGFSGLGSR
ncbi:MAG: oligosaccharide flippase family protein, partial [Chloroflexota bacterium]